MTSQPPRPVAPRRAALAAALTLAAVALAAVDRARSIVGQSASADGDLTAADGYIPDGQSVSPFDNDLPAIASHIRPRSSLPADAAS